MKKAAVILAVIALLVLSQMCYAVDLQQGWYVKLSGFATFGYDPQSGHNQGIDWTFNGILGSFGPFDVTNPNSWWPQRLISVPHNVTGITSSADICLWGEPEVPVTFPINEVGVRWETNYDATQMQLELLMFKENEGFTKLWSQSKSGISDDYSNLLSEFQVIPVGYTPVFRITVIPEPSSLLAVLSALSGFFIYRRKLC